MLHPVGKLPASVYWRRRLTVLALLLAVLGGAGWLAVVLMDGRDGNATATAATTGSAPARVPALERIVPSVSSVSAPTPPEVLVTETETEAVPAAPAPGGPCTDDMISLEVRTPPSAAVGSKPIFELLVANISAVPCTRTLDKGLQELQMLDAAGARIWGSNDCFPEASVDTRTLAPGEVVAFPVLWGGLTSEPTCTAPRSAPTPGNYLVRGRLDTKISADVPLTLAPPA